ncbi:hypothetical protein CFAM422_008432 [Trichoderma lentiforme]|uniref:Uncharacterized protein n=1 Tax=Trichoderma lentiforme TaxID=1567552 RepID=A0A9P4XB24_9HYPO|nr:hypothetical protein CFAM422_008432 [Trichoderma lentiforme]
MEVISSLETVLLSQYYTKEFISISATKARYIPSDTRYMFTLWKTKSKTTCKTKSKTTSKTIWKMCGGGHSHSHSPRGRGRQSHSHHSHHSHSHSHTRRVGGCGSHSHGHDHDDHPSNGRYEPELVQIAVPEPEAKPYVCYCTGPIPPMPAPKCYPMICCYKDAPPNCNWPVMPPNCLPPPCLPAPCLPANCLPANCLPPGSFSYVCPPPPASDEFRLEVIDTSDGRNRARNGEKYTITIDSKATIDDVFYMVDCRNEKDVNVRWKNDILEELTQEIRVGELRRNAKCLVVTDFCCGH